jgi:hypothetical protein
MIQSNSNVGFFPLWEQNFLQTFGLSNPDDAKVADLPFLAQAIAERPKDYLQQLLAYYQSYGGIFKVCPCQLGLTQISRELLGCCSGMSGPQGVPHCVRPGHRAPCPFRQVRISIASV